MKPKVIGTVAAAVLVLALVSVASRNRSKPFTTVVLSENWSVKFYADGFPFTEVIYGEVWRRENLVYKLKALYPKTTLRALVRFKLYTARRGSIVGIADAGDPLVLVLLLDLKQPSCWPAQLGDLKDEDDTENMGRRMLSIVNGETGLNLRRYLDPVE